jgi:hypothetical protein
MFLNDSQQNIYFSRFLELLESCYEGKLKAFSDDFSKFDETFYEKLKKEVQRARGGNISLKKEDAFKKYIFFLEYKLWEKNNTDMKMKKFDINIDGLIKSICK